VFDFKYFEVRKEIYIQSTTKIVGIFQREPMKSNYDKDVFFFFLSDIKLIELVGRIS